MGPGEAFPLKPARVLALLALAAAATAAIVLLAVPHSGRTVRAGRLVRACPSGQTRELDGHGCEPRFHPESFEDLARANSSRTSQVTAPFDSVEPGAYQAALGQKAALADSGPTVP